MVQFKKHINKSRKLARRINFQGLDISIETDKGQYRHWYDPYGEESGKTKMTYPYGYIRRTMGADDEHVDVFVGPHDKSEKIFVIHQMKKPDFEKYDEDKVMVGFNTAKEAKQAYLANYNDNRFFGTMDIMTMDEFKNKFVKKSKDILPGGLADEANPSNFDSEQLGEGIQHELEHVSDREIAREIAMDHLAEDPKYYTHLKQIEKNIEQGEEQQPQPPSALPEQDPMLQMDPFDIDNIQAVQGMVSQIMGMKDKDLLKIAERVWGPGYDYQITDINYVKYELLGYLQDRYDLLEIMPQMMPVQDLPDPKMLDHSDYQTLEPESVEAMHQQDPDPV